MTDVYSPVDTVADGYRDNVETILIVDDEPNNLKVLYDLLSQHSYEVRAARDGQMALDTVQAATPDLILLDIKMPGMTGYDVCQRLKANPETRDVPVIFISALNQVEDIVKAFDVGGVDYITKPFQHAEVMARVRTHLTIIQQQRQLTFQQEQIAAMRRRDRDRFDHLTAMREQFVRSAAHDLKNPLALVTGYASMLRRFDEVRTSPKILECVEQIEYSGEQMLSLITSMLDYVRMQSGLNLDLEQVSLPDFLANIIDGHRANAQEKGINLVFKAPDEDLHVKIDRQLMKRVFDNLLSNAIKYSPADTTTEVELVVDRNRAATHIRDQGYGIQQDEIPHLFEPFYRAAQKGQDIEGSGLGLSVVREILQQHIGSIEVKSTPGKGSTFSVYLPLR